MTTFGASLTAPLLSAAVANPSQDAPVAAIVANPSQDAPLAAGDNMGQTDGQSALVEPDPNANAVVSQRAPAPRPTRSVPPPLPLTNTPSDSIFELLCAEQIDVLNTFIAAKSKLSRKQASERVFQLIMATLALVSVSLSEKMFPTWAPINALVLFPILQAGFAIWAINTARIHFREQENFGIYHGKPYRKELCVEDFGVILTGMPLCFPWAVSYIGVLFVLRCKSSFWDMVRCKFSGGFKDHNGNPVQFWDMDNVGGFCMFAMVNALTFVCTTPYVLWKSLVVLKDSLITAFSQGPGEIGVHAMQQYHADDPDGFILSRVVFTTAKFLPVAMCSVYMSYFYQMQLSRIGDRLSQCNYQGSAVDIPSKNFKLPLGESSEEATARNCGSCIWMIMLTLWFSASMGFKYALASQPVYMKEYLTHVNASASFPVELLKLTCDTDWLTARELTPAQHAIRTFWVIFFGLVLTMGAMRRCIWALHSAVMTQMKALQPNEILKAAEGQVQRTALCKLLEMAKTVYASKDCIPIECLNLTVAMFLFVGFVEGGVLLASVASKGGDVQKSFAQSPELFVSTAGTVVPLTFFIMHAAHPLVACNDKLKKCKDALKVVKRDFEKMKTMLGDDKVPASVDPGFEAAAMFVEKELGDIGKVTLFGVPYSRGSQLVFFLIIPACQLGAGVFQVLKLAQQTR